MSSTNVEVVRRQFAAFGRGGLEEVARHWHPDIDWRAVEGAADDVGVMRGTQALRLYYEDWLDTFDDLHAEVDEVIAEAGERVAVVVHHRGRGRASGVSIDGRYYVVCTVKERKILSGREYETREQALEAMALSEEDAHR
jgi:ketosteroid isomerase-like protein